MAIFKREIEIDETYLTKDEILADLEDELEFHHKDWYVLPFEKRSYDLLLIKTFNKTVTKYINPGAPNPLHKDKQEPVQLAVAVTIDVDRVDVSEKFFNETRDWTFMHIVSNNVRAVIRTLKKIDRENS